jgi:hypothetical protein
MSGSLLHSGQQSPEGDLAPEETASGASSHKRPIHARNSSTTKRNNHNGRKRQKFEKAPGRPENSGLSFACLFYKWDPVTYGGENGCSGWCNENIETVVRHHVLDKHRKANKVRIAGNEAHYLEDERFEEVVKFKRKRSSGKSKEKHAEEMWKAVYALLFGIDREAKDEVPDPYFVSRTRPNNSGYNIDDLERIIQRRVSEQPSLGLECEYYFRQNAKLEREREREKKKVRLAADHQEGQLKAQIRDIREEQATQEQEIDAQFDERISNNRSQVMAILNAGVEFDTQFSRNPPPASAAHHDTSLGFESLIAPQASRSQISRSPQGYTDTQRGFFEHNTEAMLRQEDTTASPTATTPQIWSSNPSFSMNQCGMCARTTSGESVWCEECRSLTGLDGI